MAPFCIAAANGCFYGALDVAQHLPAHVADGCAEGVDTIRGGEIVDRLKAIREELISMKKALDGFTYEQVDELKKDIQQG